MPNTITIQNTYKFKKTAKQFDAPIVHLINANTDLPNVLQAFYIPT